MERYNLRATTTESFIEGNPQWVEVDEGLTEQEAYDIRIKFMAEYPNLYCQMYKA